MTRNRRRISSALAGSTFVAALALFAQPSHAGTIDVTPSNMGNWAFDNRDASGDPGLNPTGSGAMVTGPATPPLGTGSANLATGNGATGGDGAEELRNSGYAGTLISSITALSYSTYVTQNNGSQFPYLGLTISLTGGTTADDVLFFEPPYQTPGSGNPSLANEGPTALNTWQNWNALLGGWWDNDGILSCSPGSGVESLQTCLGTYYATATIANAAGGLGGVRLDVGFATDTDQFNGYVDDFTIGINDVNTTFNFDPSAVAASVPEPVTLSIFGAGLAGAAVLRRRRKTTKA